MSILLENPASILTTIQPYLNPGTGGLIIQLILGGLFAVGLAVRVFWSRIKRMGTPRTPQSDQPVDPKKDETE